MALVMLGGGVTDVRGSMAGNTFSRNKGGNYLRARTKPCNPRSTTQNTRRAKLAYLTRAWGKTCTEQERTDWRAYALGTTWHNKLGQVVEINGLAAYLRLNALIGILEGTHRFAAPTAMGHAGGIAFTFLAESDTSKIQLNLPTGSWDNAMLGHHLLLFQGIPTEVGCIGIPKGFKYIGETYGHPSAPVTYPFEINAAYTMAEGQRVTLRGIFLDEDYRVAGPFFSMVLAAPAV